MLHASTFVLALCPDADTSTLGNIHTHSLTLVLSQLLTSPLLALSQWKNGPQGRCPSQDDNLKP